MMASSQLLLEKVSDVTECPICTEMMVEPKLLPCIHSFCLKCLNQFWKDKQPGDKVPCPFCRVEFTIPSGGLADLKTNFFIEKLTDAQKISTQVQNSKCDICSSREIEKNAIQFCVDCRQKLCEECNEVHKLLNGTKCHQALSTKECIKTDGLLKLFSTYCSQHDDKRIEIYCLECKCALCTTCFILKHNGHKGADISEVIDDLRVQIKKGIEITDEIVHEIDSESHTLEELMENFKVSVQTTEKKILQDAEKIKSVIDKHVEDLLAKLNSEKAMKLKELETAKEDLLVQKVNCGSFKHYAEEVLNKAVPAEVARVASDLNKMADDLKRARIVFISKPIEVSYVPSEFVASTTTDDDGLSDTNNNIMGTLNMPRIEFDNTCWKLWNYEEEIPKFVTKIECSNRVKGLFVSGDELFVSIYKSDELKIYNTETFVYQSSISVEGLYYPCHMTGSGNILCVCDTYGKFYCVELSTKSSKSWSANDGSVASLSMNIHGNLLVTIEKTNRLVEFTPDGIQQREIVLRDGVVKPQHAIQLNDDKFLVCQSGGSNLHRVCFVDNNGRILKSYGITRGSGKDQLDKPCRMVVDRRGFVLVADSENKRVVILNGELEYVKELRLQSEEDPVGDICLHGGKLYVSNSDISHVSIYDLCA